MVQRHRILSSVAMKKQLILVPIFWVSLLALFSRANAEGEDDESDEEIVYHFGHNSTYEERQWNLTRDSDVIKDEYVEDCTLQTAPKLSDTNKLHSSGPLCEICSRVIPKKFPPEESIKMRYSGFLHGILTFPSATDELLIDAVLCSYDPEIGLDRFYVTNGGNRSSVYVLENVGWQKSAEITHPKDSKFKFELEKHVVLDVPW